MDRKGQDRAGNAGLVNGGQYKSGQSREHWAGQGRTIKWIQGQVVAG